MKINLFAELIKIQLDALYEMYDATIKKGIAHEIDLAYNPQNPSKHGIVPFDLLYDYVAQTHDLKPSEERKKVFWSMAKEKYLADNSEVISRKIQFYAAKFAGENKPLTERHPPTEEMLSKAKKTVMDSLKKDIEKLFKSYLVRDFLLTRYKETGERLKLYNDDGSELKVKSWLR